MKYLIILLLLLLPTALALENETIAITLNLNSTIENTNNCNIILSISTQKESYNPGEQIQFYNNLSDKNRNYKIKYYIIDEQNQIIKQPVITQNLNQKTFTPNQKKNDYEITIKNELLEIDCNNVNTIKTAEKTILIEGNPNITEEEAKTVTIKQSTKEPTIKTSGKQATTKQTANKTEARQKDYTITPLAQFESLLNNKGGENATEMFISAEEKSRSYAFYMLIAALIILTIYLMKNGFQNKRNN